MTRYSQLPHRLCAVLLLAFLMVTATVTAAELRGRVVLLDGATVILQIDGDMMPRENDPVSLGFEMDGETIFIAGDWRITEVREDGARAAPQGPSSGKPGLGHLAVIQSARPQTRDEIRKGPAAAPASAPEPANPQPLARTRESDTAANVRELLAEGHEEEAFQAATEGAEAGDIPCTTLLGYMYWKGHGTAVDIRKAGRLLDAAATKGSAEAWYYLGCMFRDKAFDKEDHHDLMIAAFTKSAESDFAPAIYELAVCYQSGLGLDVDLVAAARLFKRGAELSSIECMLNYAWALQDGTGVQQDFQEAYRWIKLAADQHHPDALNELGVCYTKGLGVQADADAAVTSFTQAIEMSSSTAMRNLALLYETGESVQQDLPMAVDLYTMAAKAEDPEAMYRLADLLLNQPVVEDRLEGLDWMAAAVKSEFPLALTHSGLIFENGLHGVDKNEPKARTMFERATELGDPSGTCNLGIFYRFGRGGLEENDEMAVKCFRYAAESGLAQGMYLYGWMLMNGQGIPQNKAAALLWYKQAARAGQVDAQTALQLLKETW